MNAPCNPIAIAGADGILEHAELNSSLFEILDKAELRMIEFAMSQTFGNKRKAAGVLGINESTLKMKIKRFKMGFRTDWSYPETYPFPPPLRPQVKTDDNQA